MKRLTTLLAVDSSANYKNIDGQLDSTEPKINLLRKLAKYYDWDWLTVEADIARNALIITFKCVERGNNNNNIIGTEETNWFYRKDDNYIAGYTVSALGRTDFISPKKAHYHKIMQPIEMWALETQAFKINAELNLEDKL